jgi:hypothetical protein
MHKLLCAEIVHSLRFKPICIMLPPHGEPVLSEASDKTRQKILAPILPLIHQSQKFIFDSGSDHDEQNLSAVKDTAVNMIEAGLFHQPHPVMWIEDPFEENPDTHRNFYLCIEKDHQIKIWYMALIDLKSIDPNSHEKPFVLVYPSELIIDLSEATDKWGTKGVSIGSDLAKILSEAVYSFKKMIVTLNTANQHYDKIVGKTVGNKKWDGNPRSRPYTYTVVSVPYDDTGAAGNRGESGSGIKMRKQLVRGYVWGKNIRSKEQQHWVRPYWRGENEIVERTHYEVRADR